MASAKQNRIVRRGRIPNWMRLAWMQKRPAKHQIYTRHLSGPMCGDEMQSMVGRPAWDHCGSTVIDGQACFVSEPYSTEEEAAKAFAPLAELLGCKMATSKDSDYGYSTIRVVLYPPIENCADSPQK